MKSVVTSLILLAMINCIMGTYNSTPRASMVKWLYLDIWKTRSFSKTVQINVALWLLFCCSGQTFLKPMIVLELFSTVMTDFVVYRSSLWYNKPKGNSSRSVLISIVTWLLQLKTIRTSRYVWWTGSMTAKGEWKYFITEGGERSVTTAGTSRTLLLSAGCWASRKLWRH